RVPDPNRRDEIGQLARVLNRTLERLERNFRIQQRFFADVSHELRTPLTTIRGNVDLIRRF
ncbi:MAG: HAMP domain-containing protein, partial [Anaerolineales bacterium]|nr:HAMP domain-containing protein [Anaerolineales bacterium]